MESLKNTIDQSINDNPNASVLSSALFYGCILAAISIGLGIIAHITKWDTQDAAYKGLTWILLISGPVWAIWDFKNRRNKGYLGFGQGVGLATLTGLISGILGGIYIVVYMKFINPGFIDQLMETSYEQLVEQGLSESQIDQAMKMTELFLSPTALAIMSIVSWVFVSLIVGLIASAIMKRD